MKVAQSWLQAIIWHFLNYFFILLAPVQLLIHNGVKTPCWLRVKGPLLILERLTEALNKLSRWRLSRCKTIVAIYSFVYGIIWQWPSPMLQNCGTIFIPLLCTNLGVGGCGAAHKTKNLNDAVFETWSWGLTSHNPLEWKNMVIEGSGR